MSSENLTVLNGHSPANSQHAGKNPSTGVPQRVLLVVMPCAGVRYGVLGVSTLKAILERDGISCDIRHLNLKFARKVGEIYSLISDSSRGEIFFTPYYFNVPFEQFLRSTLPTYYEKLLEALRDSLLAFRKTVDRQEFLKICENICRKHVGTFLSECMAEIPWDLYDIVGFSLMFDQTVPSLCLTQKIKQRFPDKKIIFGGANCDGEMGIEILRSFECVDAVAIGEADQTITPLVRSLRGRLPLTSVPGIAFRENGEVMQTPSAPLLTELDALPLPNYDDYISQLGQPPDIEPHLFFETSRGCWWGQKHLCSFCGLNANGLAFRRKSAGRALQEVLMLERRYNIHKFTATDNILDVSYFKTVLPELARINHERPDDKKMSFFYEMKSNAKKQQVKLLKQAGINHAQPGIESFSDHILSLMKKGATSMQQVQFVKWATEMGIVITYGILYGFPGEEPTDYEEMADLVDYILHLQPPMYFTSVALDRFSPYFLNPTMHGIRNIRPSQYYHDIFPDTRIDLNRLAYRFAYEHDLMSNQQLQAATQHCLGKLRKWRNEFTSDTLVYSRQGGTVYLLDRRGGERIQAVLKPPESDIFLYCDEQRAFSDLRNKFHFIREAELTAFLGLMVSRKWMYCDRRGRYLSLPTDLRPEKYAEEGNVVAGADFSTVLTAFPPDSLTRAAPPDPRYKNAPNG